MAEVIRMTPQELRDGAAYLDQRKTEIIDLMGQIKSKVDEVASNWEGAAQSAFVQTFETLYNQINTQLPELVDGIESMMTGSADALEQADEQIASSIQG